MPRGSVAEGTEDHRTLRALAWMDARNNVFPYLRCYHLVQLCKCQQDLREQYRVSFSKGEGLSLKYGFREKVMKMTSGGTKRASRKALEEEMRQAHPETAGKPSVEYNKRLNALQNRLSDGRNSYRMYERLGIGILALVPSGKDVAVTNAEYVLPLVVGHLSDLRSVEKAPQPVFDCCLELLTSG